MGRDQLSRAPSGGEAFPSSFGRGGFSPGFLRGGEEVFSFAPHGSPHAFPSPGPFLHLCFSPHVGGEKMKLRETKSPLCKKGCSESPPFGALCQVSTCPRYGQRVSEVSLSPTLDFVPSLADGWARTAAFPRIHSISTYTTSGPACQATQPPRRGFFRRWQRQPGPHAKQVASTCWQKTCAPGGPPVGSAGSIKCPITRATPPDPKQVLPRLPHPFQHLLVDHPLVMHPLDVTIVKAHVHP